MNTIIRYRSSDFVHRVLMSKAKKQWEMNLWCQEQFGPRWEVTGNRSGRWCVFWRGLRDEDSSTYEWLFVNEDDAMWFSLRWA